MKNHKPPAQAPSNDASTKSGADDNSLAPSKTHNQGIEQSNQPVSFWAVIGSVFAALFGIQNSKNRERDFQQGKASTFIVVGVIMVIALIITMVIVVKTVISSAGA